MSKSPNFLDERDYKRKSESETLIELKKRNWRKSLFNSEVSDAAYLFVFLNVKHLTTGLFSIVPLANRD